MFFQDFHGVSLGGLIGPGGAFELENHSFFLWESRQYLKRSRIALWPLAIDAPWSVERPTYKVSYLPPTRSEVTVKKLCPGEWKKCQAALKPGKLQSVNHDITKIFPLPVGCDPTVRNARAALSSEPFLSSRSTSLAEKQFYNRLFPL